MTEIAYGLMLTSGLAAVLTAACTDLARVWHLTPSPAGRWTLRLYRSGAAVLVVVCLIHRPSDHPPIGVLGVAAYLALAAGIPSTRAVFQRRRPQ